MAAALIAALRDEHQIPHPIACRALGESSFRFCKWRDGTLTPRAARRAVLAAEVRRLFKAHRAPAGRRVLPLTCGRRAGRSARTLSRRSCASKARPPGARRSAGPPPGQARGRWRAPDLVKRDFPAQQVNRKWYGDGTEIPTGQGKLYLASVMDMASRRILGHALGEHHDAASRAGRSWAA